MAQRESSVYLVLFIASFLLFIGAVVGVFVEDSRRTYLAGKLVDEEKKVVVEKKRGDQYNKELSDLRLLVGGAQAKESWPGDEVYIQKKQAAEDYINEMYKQLEGKAPKSLPAMIDAYDDYKDIVKKIRDAQQSAREHQTLAEREREEERKKNIEEVKRQEAQVALLKSQISDTESKYEKKVSDLTKDGERLQKELATIKDQMASAEIEWSRKLQYSDNVKNSLLARLDQLLEEQRKTKTIEDVEPDGKILQVVSSSQIGWINIGRKQHLRPGLDFQVFQNVKGGKRQYKGRIQVRRVDESISEFRITGVTDELNPITQGDYITSPFYDPKQVPVFVFAGEGLESKDVTEEGLKAKIKSYGAEIKNDVDLKTSFVVALKNYENSAPFKKARELGIAVLREREILEYMGL
jgi:hypothetical protein